VLDDFLNEAAVLISYTFFLWSMMAILEETKNRRECLKWFGISLVVASLFKAILSITVEQFCTNRTWILIRMLFNFSIVLYVGIGQWISNYTLGKIKGFVDDEGHNSYLNSEASGSPENAAKMESLNVKFMISQIF
jgi:hypothetical protein